jgi:carboxypeptidase C (cathepsin A)
LAFEDDRTTLPGFPYTGPLYSGYLPLEGTQKSLHYVFVPSQSDAVNDPVLLWLNGGPGCSSLEGFSSENGPATLGYEGQDWKLNPYSWNQKANVLYIESPAGVGFYFNDSPDPEQQKEDDDISGVENLQAVIQFFTKFPSYKQNEFYISGESYAGIYLPYLASNIIDYNAQNPDDKINLKGMYVGNGVTDWKVDATGGAMVDYAYTHALYGTDLRETYEKNCLSTTGDAQTCQDATNQISNLIAKVNIYSIYDTCYLTPQKMKMSMKERYRYTPWLLNTIFKNVKHENKNEQFFNLRKAGQTLDNSGCFDDGVAQTYYNRSDVKQALNVRENINWVMCGDVNYNMGISTGSYHLYPKLIASGIRIVKFSGDNDMCVSFNGTEKWIKNLNLPILKEWKSWNVPGDSNTGGMVTHYEGLTFITIRGAGHMVSQKKPVEAFYLINQYLTGQDF